VSERKRIEELERYYRLRAPEYERIYERVDPVRQRELGVAGDRARKFLAGRRVLEIACGTGYWTEVVSEVVKEVVATDASSEMLDFARNKKYPLTNVHFQLADAYRLDRIPGDFDAGMANFWISHVPRANVDLFLRVFHKRLGEGSRVFMIDNLNTPGYGGEFLVEPGSEDTFKLRELKDGSKHKVIKNYYDERELGRFLRPHARDIKIQTWEYYWCLTYTVTGE
jgi:ubiquinone/menaquinone biosynthesis C-methylase UbiE